MRLGVLFSILFCGSVWAVDVGQTAPNFSLPGFQGNKISLSKYPGYVVLVNFWATWCAPCKKELPELKKLQNQMADKGFTVIGVNLDKNRIHADKFIRKFGLNYPNGHDPKSKIITAYNGQAMPTSYLIGRDGKVKKIFLGFTSKKLVKMKEAILAALSTR